MTIQDSVPTGGTTAEQAEGLPDVNVETYPFPLVQSLLDQAANFNLFAQPEPPGAAEPTITPHDPADFFGIHAGYGFAIRSSLHRFDAPIGEVSRALGVQARQSVGKAKGRFESRWLIAAEGFDWDPGREPPPAIFNPASSQRFAMLDSRFKVGTRGDSLEGYGVGRTFPVDVGGVPHLLVSGIGNLTRGHGRFQGLSGGFALNGRLYQSGFQGNVTLRLPDPKGRVRTDRPVPGIETPIPFPDDTATYLVLRGEKQDRYVRTEYGPPPGPGLVNLVTPAKMHSVKFPWTEHGRGGLRTRKEVGQTVADLRASVNLDILAPPGTADRPNSFTTENTYTFRTPDGHEVGTVRAFVSFGKSFSLEFPSAPGQPGMRYGGYGPILSGSGVFAGAQGSVTVNSAIGIRPHALSMINVLRLVDPVGEYRPGSQGTP